MIGSIYAMTRYERYGYER